MNVALNKFSRSALRKLYGSISYHFTTYEYSNLKYMFWSLIAANSIMKVNSSSGTKRYYLYSPASAQATNVA